MRYNVVQTKMQIDFDILTVLSCRLGEEMVDLRWNLFMRVLTLCHSVQVELFTHHAVDRVHSALQVQDGQFVASSPDEKAILEFCRQHSFLFCGPGEPGEVTNKN